MSTDKLLWAEGIVLGQQQFQQWDAYLEQASITRCQAIAPHHWGVLGYTIDERQLRIGELTVHACRALFADGSLVDYHAQRHLPLGLDLNALDDDINTIYLALPRTHTAKGIAGYVEQPHPRWQADYRMVSDRFDADKQREVLFGAPMLTLVTTPKEPSLTLPLMCVRRVGAGQYQLDEPFIPSCCHIQVSHYLLSLVTHWQRALQQTLARFRQMSDISSEQQLIVMVTKQALCQLRQLQQQTLSHPIILYQIICQWLSGIARTSVAGELIDLQEFRQESLTRVFTTLAQIVSQQLETLPDRQAMSLVLQQQQPGWWNSGAIDESLLKSRQCLLLVQHSNPSMSWVNKFIELTKVASTAAMPGLLAAALPGIPLQFHGNKIDSQSTDESVMWFTLDMTHPLWQEIKTQRQLTVCTSDASTTVTMTLLFK
jgi:type VI secretion system protein ImpJ